jgi:hypothetical protein
VEKWVRRRRWKSGQEGVEAEKWVGRAEAEKLGMECRRWKQG